MPMQAMVVGVGIPIKRDVTPEGDTGLRKKMCRKTQTVKAPLTTKRLRNGQLPAGGESRMIQHSMSSPQGQKNGNDLWHRLEELRRKRAEIERKWDAEIDGKILERDAIVGRKLAEKEHKLEQLEKEFCPQCFEMDQEIVQMKETAGVLMSLGRRDEAEGVMMTAKQAEIGSLGNAEFIRARELQARKAELAKVYDRAIATATKKIDADIETLKRQKITELKPIDGEIRALERLLKKS